VTKTNILEDDTLMSLFTETVKEIVPSATLSCIKRVHKILVSKLYNCRCNEYLNGINQKNLMKENKTVTACVGLRDKLKLYATEKQLK